MSLILQITPIIIIPIILLVIGVIVFASYYFSVKQIIIRTLKKTNSKTAGGLKTNEFTKVSGKALHVTEPLIAPLSGRKCIFYI